VVIGATASPDGQVVIHGANGRSWDARTAEPVLTNLAPSRSAERNSLVSRSNRGPMINPDGFGRDMTRHSRMNSFAVNGDIFNGGHRVSLDGGLTIDSIHRLSDGKRPLDINRSDEISDIKVPEVPIENPAQPVDTTPIINETNQTRRPSGCSG